MQTKIIKINPNFPEEALIKEAAIALQKGKLVSFPTETVYGIGANFLDKKAIDRLYAVKKRPKNKPFTVHIAGFEALKDLKIVLSEHAERVIRKFWPGPLTIVAFNKKKEKIGLRMPRNKIALELISKAGIPIVAPSANISGKKPPLSGKEVILEMDGLVDMILDAGNTEVGKESTVLDVTKDPFTILRPGAIPKEDLLMTYQILFVCTGNSCRSVMAKAMLQKYIREARFSKNVIVDSAGTGSCAAVRAAANTIQVMREEGVDVSLHRGKSVTPELLKKSDFIFVMERTHRSAILGMLPGADSRIRLLRETEDIPDPVGKSLEEYRYVRGIIKDKVENIFLELFKKEKER
ncbi:MAG: threonylcarbamoyl-AMP synthase [Candidatus Omnitrophica bacterium]|nr:threonylcarbamoyl-AMP synthase [Candidatus Omnitrophota bacterium]